MEIKTITKTDGKRLFVEISKNLKTSSTLPEIKKGDEVLLLPIRKLSNLNNLLGKYIKYLELEEETQFAMFFEGILDKNQKKYWQEDDDEEFRKSKYVLVGPNDEIEDTFDDLNDVFDLEVMEGKEKQFKKTTCHKCKKQILLSHKFCPHCGKANKEYTRK